MVGLQGVVTRVANRNRRLVRYAGSVPIVGCDRFELASLAASPTAREKELELTDADRPHGPPTLIVPQVLSTSDEQWRSPVLRLLRAFEEVRGKWRAALQKLLESERRNGTATNGGGGGGNAVVAQVAQVLSSHFAQQLLEAARTGSLQALVDTNGEPVKIEMVDNGDGDVVFQLGG